MNVKTTDNNLELKVTNRGVIIRKIIPIKNPKTSENER
jgi:hypothetical protein